MRKKDHCGNEEIGYLLVSPSWVKINFSYLVWAILSMICTVWYFYFIVLQLIGPNMEQKGSKNVQYLEGYIFSTFLCTAIAVYKYHGKYHENHK